MAGDAIWNLCIAAALTASDRQEGAVSIRNTELKAAAGVTLVLVEELGPTGKVTATRYQLSMQTEPVARDRGSPGGRGRLRYRGDGVAGGLDGPDPDPARRALVQPLPVKSRNQFTRRGFAITRIVHEDRGDRPAGAPLRKRPSA